MTIESPNARILIVEDEWVIALDIRHRLSKLGYCDVGIAKDGATALKLAAESNPDLVLVDIYLQGKTDGIQLATQLRTQFHLPVVFLTAHADKTTIKQALAAHPFGYIVKPFKDNDLDTSIQIALANHQAEMTMQQAIAKEKELNELKSHFVSIVSHEFRNPLSSLTVVFDLLAYPNSQASSEQYQSHLQRGKTVVKEMTKLIDDVLVMGEVNRDQFICQPVPINLASVCQSLIENLQTSIGRNHRLVLTLQESTELKEYFCNLDTKLLNHILTNLLSNAIKYSPAHSEVRLAVTYDAESVTFAIHDQGIGIPILDQVHLFTPFHRGMNVRQIHGTGLGLSIVKRCVEAHGGTIAVDSDEGVGTTITVTLPTSSPVR